MRIHSVTRYEVPASTQHEDINKLNAAIGRIDDDSQHNAAQVEQTAAVAESLRVQVQSLLEAVGTFTIADVSNVPVAAPPPATAIETRLAA